MLEVTGFTCKSYTVFEETGSFKNVFEGTGSFKKCFTLCNVCRRIVHHPRTACVSSRVLGDVFTSASATRLTDETFMSNVCPHRRQGPIIIIVINEIIN